MASPERIIKVVVSGPPKSGKSTIAAEIAYLLHEEGFSVQIADEDHGVRSLFKKLRYTDHLKKGASDETVISIVSAKNRRKRRGRS